MADARRVEHARGDLEERLGIVEADGVADARSVAEAAVRTSLLRSIT